MVSLAILAVFAVVLIPEPSDSKHGGPPTSARPAPVLPPPPIAPSRALPFFRQAERCDGPQQFAQAAAWNGRSAQELEWAPFRRPESGWEIYAPLIGREIDSTCALDSPAFAAALARWQREHRLRGDGAFTALDFALMNGRWQQVRDAVRRRGECPMPPPENALAIAAPNESYGGKLIQLRPGALSAYQAMIAAARTDNPGLAPQYFQIFSAFRSPEYDAARCAHDGNCDGIRRAVSCSPHRTGLAMDLYLGAAPGYGPDSSQDENRLYISRGPAYRWLVANAGRFGFVNYPFEPWHWEWTGEPW